MINKVFGLVGNPVKHSFSQKYFEEKFLNLHLTDCKYKLFCLKDINDFYKLIKEERNLCGLNVTSPYKEKVIEFLHSLSPEATEIKAVNTIKKLADGRWKGFNTDCIGFSQMLQSETDIKKIHSALVLGSGGASKAVTYALKQLGIEFTVASRRQDVKDKNTVTYFELNQSENFSAFELIVNATPCGMEGYPAIAPLNTDKITSNHTVVDLIYNPKQTLLLKTSAKQGAATVNGLSMLVKQAEAAWQIWNKKDE
ncbi:MAG: shikimate dehydrogenase [Bacteroidales bacterium]|nr:shikimate dehydrogenase [Bacteroidales bacterium]